MIATWCHALSQTLMVKGGVVAINGVHETTKEGLLTEAHERGALAGEVHCDQMVHVLGPATTPELRVTALAVEPAAPQASTV